MHAKHLRTAHVLSDADAINSRFTTTSMCVKTKTSDTKEAPTSASECQQKHTTVKLQLNRSLSHSINIKILDNTSKRI